MINIYFSKTTRPRPGAGAALAGARPERLHDDPEVPGALQHYYYY